MLATIIEVVAGVSAVIGSIYLLMFMVSMIISSMQPKWKRYIGRALFFYGIVALITALAIVFQIPV
ncbi:MAG: hypothetical protein E6713_20315 [Sporomusaceae bacterium]|nr:hypothetical protein [Sporomusaceae bacterium]